MPLLYLNNSTNLFWMKIHSFASLKQNYVTPTYIGHASVDAHTTCRIDYEFTVMSDD